MAPVARSRGARRLRVAAGASLLDLPAKGAP